MPRWPTRAPPTLDVKRTTRFRSGSSTSQSTRSTSRRSGSRACSSKCSSAPRRRAPRAVSPSSTRPAARGGSSRRGRQPAPRCSAIELDELAAPRRDKALGSPNVRTGDLLDYRNLLTGFSLVVTNPPYGIYWHHAEPRRSSGPARRLGPGSSRARAATTRDRDPRARLRRLPRRDRPHLHLREHEGPRPPETCSTRDFEGITPASRSRTSSETSTASPSTPTSSSPRNASTGAPAAAGARIHLTAEGDSSSGILRAAFRDALIDGTHGTSRRRNPRPFPSSPVSSRVTPSSDVRVTPKGVASAADVTGLLAFLDETVTAFDPVRGIEHGIVAATLSPASLITLGPDTGLDDTLGLGFDPSITDTDRDRIDTPPGHYRHPADAALPTSAAPAPRLHRRPHLHGEGDRRRTATLPLFTAGRPTTSGPPGCAIARSPRSRPSGTSRLKARRPAHHLSRPRLPLVPVRHRQPARGSFGRSTSTTSRSSPTAFELPDTPDLEATHGAASRRAQPAHRREAVPVPVSLPAGGRRPSRGETVRVPRLRAGRRQDRHRGRVGGDAGLQARARRLPVVTRRELARTSSSSSASRLTRLTTHSGITDLQAEKRAKHLPADHDVLRHEFEFLASPASRIYDAWACRAFTKDGAISHQITRQPQGRRAGCASAPTSDVITSCPTVSATEAWTGGSATPAATRRGPPHADARQWPAYKRIKKLFCAVLVDEAQVAKSKNTLRGRAVRALRPKGGCILTGTLMKGYPTTSSGTCRGCSASTPRCSPTRIAAGPSASSTSSAPTSTSPGSSRRPLRGAREAPPGGLEPQSLLAPPGGLRRPATQGRSLRASRRSDARSRARARPRPPASLRRLRRTWASARSAKALRQNNGNPNMGVISNALWKLRYAATCPVAVDIPRPWRPRPPPRGTSSRRSTLS